MKMRRLAIMLLLILTCATLRAQVVCGGYMYTFSVN